jgi:hypothetical protein
MPASITELRDAYDLNCPCGQQWLVRPSIFMRWGYNRGGGRCSACGRWLRLQLTDAGEMSATVIDLDADAQPGGAR